MYGTLSKNNDQLATVSEAELVGQAELTPCKGVDRTTDFTNTKSPGQQPSSVRGINGIADPIANLINQAERLYKTDELRAGQHYLILMELHALDFARRGFGPRAFDGTASGIAGMLFEAAKYADFLAL